MAQVVTFTLLNAISLAVYQVGKQGALEFDLSLWAP